MGEANDDGNECEDPDVAIGQNHTQCYDFNSTPTELCEPSTPPCNISKVSDAKVMKDEEVVDSSDLLSETECSEELGSDSTEEDPNAITSMDYAEDRLELNSSLDPSQLSLHQAVKTGDYELVKEILTSRPSIDLNEKDEENTSCLHEACIHSCQFTKIAELLLQHGADPNITDDNGETPLHGSTLFHYTDNIKLLCKYKADFKLCNNDGISALDIAVYAKDLEVLEIFGQSLPTPSEKTPKKGAKAKPIRKGLRRSVLRPRNTEELEYIPSPLSSPSILKKRKRLNDDDDDDVGSPSAKKSISFSGKDRYTPSSLYR